MAKKEKVIDLKSKPEKITDEQLEKVQNTVIPINRAQLEIGSIQQEISETQEELEKEYGSADVNIQTGEIKYPENGEVDKKD